MTYVEIKTIGGRSYKYARTSYRVNGKVRHKSKYLGPVEPLKSWKRGRKRKPGGGRKPALFARHLKASEKEVLDKARGSSKSFTKERAEMILSSSMGWNAEEIARTLHRDVKRVRAAIKDFNERSLACLERGKSTGRKPVFTKEQRAEILALASARPTSVGEAFTTWSLPKLKRHLSGKGLKISVEGLRQVLKQEHFKLKKSRKFQYSKDPDFVKKNSK